MYNFLFASMAPNRDLSVALALEQKEGQENNSQ